jgi:hypothetical protein
MRRKRGGISGVEDFDFHAGVVWLSQQISGYVFPEPSMCLA